MYYLVLIAAAAVFSGLTVVLFKQKKIDRTVVFKIFAIIMLVVFILRYYFYNDRPADVIGLDGFGMNPIIVALCNTFMWLSYPAVLTLMMKPFFKLNNIQNLIKFVFTPVYIVQICLMRYTMDFLFYDGAWGEWGFTQIMYAVELGLAAVMCAQYWFVSPTFKTTAREKRTLFASVVPVLLAGIPSYLFQVYFGYAKAALDVRDFSPEHRMFIYAGIIIPLIIYFCLRKKDEETRRYSLIYLSTMLMISFCLDYKIDTFLDPVKWPIHLCNTAMFVVPICLIFRLNKLFYFTYFINVMGAFIAMAMPNYGAVNIFSNHLVIFWINHLSAFFMPLLVVALGVCKRPKIKQFYYSMVAFAAYFVVVLILNVWFSNYGSVDYFFLNSDYVADKLGRWAENLFDIKTKFDIGSLTFEFHPVYQALFFLTYVGIAFGVWFVYEQFFSIAESHRDLLERTRKIKMEQYALQAALNGREADQPMYENCGIELKLDGFSKRYGNGKVYAVKDAHLTVHGGEIFGFLGPNGAGKSTIIKSIVGIQPITEGKIIVCGYDAEKQPVMTKRQIGYVPDHYTLYEKLTGREYINYIADIYDVTEADRNERINKMVERFELVGSFDNPIKTYSHGMKQKITIMAALVHEPKVWILDEPLTGLDPNSIFQVKECMREHAAKGNIVFFSSHIIDVVERICGRIAIIRKGNILLERSVEDIEKECPLEEFYMKTISASPATSGGVGMGGNNGAAATSEANAK